VKTSYKKTKDALFAVDCAKEKEKEEEDICYYTTPNSPCKTSL
jgi:hypothetical protein